MLRESLRHFRRPRLILLGLFLVVTPGVLRAQQTGVLPDAPVANGVQEPVQPAGAVAAPAQQPDSTTQTDAAKDAKPPVHHFWDKENDWLFAGVGASRVLDYTSTKNFRRRGRNEGLLTNDIVDNDALFASIEAMGVAASIGVSYWFHHAGHHKLERWTSIVHMSVSFFGDARNYALKTVHPAPAPAP